MSSLSNKWSSLYMGKTLNSEKMVLRFLGNTTYPMQTHLQTQLQIFTTSLVFQLVMLLYCQKVM